MANVLLTLVMPPDVAQDIEDLLLSRPDLVRGFTTSPADGQGSVVQLVEPDELVSGHSPRTQIRTVGSEENMRAILALIKATAPGSNVFFWLLPVIDMGRL